MLAAYQRAEEKKAAEHVKISESNSEVAENKAFLGTIIPLDDSFSERDNTDIDNNEAKDWEDKPGKMSLHLRLGLDLEKLLVQKTNWFES